MDELPLADARNRLSELVADVEKTHARVTITKHGHPAAVLVSPEDLASLEETVDILSDPEALAAIREAEAEYARGDFTTGEEMRRLNRGAPAPRERRCVSSRYELLLSCAARPALERELPVAVALAVWEFCDAPLRENPRQVGKPLGRELTSYFSARRGAYRVIYRLIEDDAVVHVVRIEHRADVYRRR